MAEQLKKPVGGAYGIFMNEKRSEFKKQADAAGGDGSVKAVAKLASAAWKAMGDKEKAPYEDKYQAAKLKYDAFKNSDAYVAPEKKDKKGKGNAKTPKDKDAPKRPAGGAYGIFMNEKREDFKRQAEAAGDKTFGGPAKLASAAWKAIGEQEKAAYEQKYQQAKAKYEQDLAAYRISKPEAPAPEKKEVTPEKSTATKRGASVSSVMSGRKRKAIKTGSSTDGVALDAAVLKEADGLGYRSNLENLAHRKVIVEAGLDGPKMLRALKASGGLVNKAQAALLGA